MADELQIGEYYSVSLRPYDAGGDTDSWLADARREYFKSGKTVRGTFRAIRDGREEKVGYRLGKKCFRWKRTCGPKTVQEVFPVADGWRLLAHDEDGRLLSAAMFDRGLHWRRTSWFAPGDSQPEAVLSRGEGSLTMQTAQGSSELFPCPWEPGTAEQSCVNAELGEPGVTVRAEGGNFCFCTEEEKEKRLGALRRIREDPNFLRPKWPAGAAGTLDFSVVRNDGGPDDPAAEPPAPMVSVPEVSASAETPQPAAGEDGPVTVMKPEAEESAGEYAANREIFTTGDKPAKYAVAAKGLSGAVRGGPKRGEPPAPAMRIVVGTGESYLYTGRLTDGLRQGRGRTETPRGQTAYEGGYRDDRREGFGVYYYKSGRLAYAGSWKNNLRDGVGAAFSARDGAIFVGNWRGNLPAGEGTQFDLSGRPVYTGGWKDGRRSGYGVEFRGGRVSRAGFWREGEFIGPEESRPAEEEKT